MFRNSVIVSEVADHLLSIPNRVENQNSNPEWTATVNDILWELGQRSGFVVCCHPSGFRKSMEWMCDVVWLPQPPAVSAVLAAESEWGSVGDVLDDFQKLLSFKAPLKALLYSFRSGSRQLQEVREKIAEYLRAYPYHIAGEEYLFIEYTGSENSARHVLIETNGQRSDFKFKALGKSAAA